MEIIDNKEKLDELVENLKNSKLKASRVGFCGKIHEGHIHIFKNVRESCDILIADLVEYATYVWEYISKKEKFLYTENELKEIFKQFESLPFVDYVVYSKTSEEHIQLANKLSTEYLDSFIKYGNELGLSRSLSIHSFLYELVTPLDLVTTSFAGPKNVVQVLLAKKIYGDKSRFHPELVWDFFRSPNGGSVYRTRGSLTLQKVVKDSKIELLNGKTNKETFKKLMSEYFLEDPNFTIIDIDSLKRVSSITDNCSLVFMDGKKEDFMHIKNGELIT